MSWFGKLFSKNPPQNVTNIKESKEGEVSVPSIDLGPPMIMDPVPEIPLTIYDAIEPLDLMKVSFAASPNRSNRRGDVKYIVLHHTGPGSFNGIVKWLCNPAAKASAHYVLSKTGHLKQLVNTGKESWHAGVAKIDGQRIDNHCSIGIEICNTGLMEKEGDDYFYTQGRQIKKYSGKAEPQHGTITYPNGETLSGYYEPYPEKQVHKLVALCKALVEKYPAITRENIITHYDIGHPIGRKNDPFGLDIEMIRDWVFQ